MTARWSGGSSARASVRRREGGFVGVGGIGEKGGGFSGEVFTGFGRGCRGG